MTNSNSHLTHAFDDFLFALIDEDEDETPLSVLSLFARLGVDPWEEAANLAQLPHASATKRLISLIVSIPSSRAASSDATAGRLLATGASTSYKMLPIRSFLKRT